MVKAESPGFVQWNKDFDKELLMLSLKRQGKPIDYAENTNINSVNLSFETKQYEGVHVVILKHFGQ